MRVRVDEQKTKKYKRERNSGNCLVVRKTIFYFFTEFFSLSEMYSNTKVHWKKSLFHKFAQLKKKNSHKLFLYKSVQIHSGS